MYFVADPEWPCLHVRNLLPPLNECRPNSGPVHLVPSLRMGIPQRSPFFLVRYCETYCVAVDHQLLRCVQTQY